MKEEIALKIENLDKVYRLGEIGTGTISHDLNRWWAKIRGKEDPYSKIGASNDRTVAAKKGEYVKVLNNINFEVKKGEVLGIIGKNGAGKSTLLKVISQITSPSSGSIKAKGRIASLLEVGTGMHPEMTGKENVYLNGTILGMTKKEIDEKFDEIMDFAGCAKYANTPVKRYSSGMKVRLGFAVAAFLEPEILIVDEVLAVGDAEFQKKAIGKMKDVSSISGRTVLFVSHNMTAVESLCHNVIILDQGSVLYEKEKPSSAIPKYLSGDTNRLAYKSWSIDKRPRCEEAIFIKAELDKENPQYFVNEKIEISFTFNCLKAFQGNLSLVLWRNGGEMVFNSISDILELNKGEYISKCKIPKDLLNDGEYQIDISLIKDTSLRILYVPEVLGFTVDDKRGKMNWHGKWEGVIRPKLDFKIVKNE